MYEPAMATNPGEIELGSQRESLSRLESDLARLNRVTLMNELSAALAHEIKQPITAARLNASTALRWLMHTPPNVEEAAEALSRLLHDITRAADIVGRNLSLYCTKGEIRRDLMDVNEVIRDVAALLQFQANRHGISIRTDLESDLAATLADRVQLEQVLMNLILNAIEAMTDVAGEVTVRSKATADGSIQVSVIDRGTGLPAGNPEGVFEAFFTTKPQGTGMGLPISRRIVESHGGTLWANANPECGATFHFTLPRTDLLSSWKRL